MKKSIIFLLLCLAFYKVEAQDTLYTFGKNKLAIKTDKNDFKLLLKKQDGTEVSQNLTEGVYHDKTAFTKVYSSIVATSNGIGASLAADTGKLREVYQKARRFYETTWLSHYKVIDTTKTSIKASLSPNLTWGFTRMNKSFQMQLCKLTNNNSTCITADSMDVHTSKYEIYMSKKEFNHILDSLTELFKHKTDTISFDGIDQLSFLKKNIYNDLIKWLSNKNVDDLKSLINVKNLAYDDSLKAEIIVSAELPIYRVFKKYADTLARPGNIPEAEKSASRINGNNSNAVSDNNLIPQFVKNQKYRNVQVGRIKVLDAKVQVYDGFLLSTTFDIDTADARKYSLKRNQTIRGGYNIRNVMFAKDELTNANVNYLKKEEYSFANIANRDSNEYIYLVDELIELKTPIHAPNAIFTAEEKLLTISHDQLGKPVPVKEKSLYSFASLDIYSDLLGLFNENNPNGLVQSELKIGTALFRKSMRQNSFRKAGDGLAVTPFNKAEIFFKFSKLDNKVRYLGVQRTASDTPYVHGINLLQYQSMNYGVRANVLNLDYRGGYTSIVGEASIYRTPLRDSTKTKTGNVIIKTPETFGINSTALSIGVNSRIHAASFLDIDFGARYIYVKPRVDSLKISNTEYNEFYINNKYVPASSVKIIDYKAMTNIYLNDEKSKRIIIRFEYFFDMKQTSNNFSTLQVGYSAALDKFLKL